MAGSYKIIIGDATKPQLIRPVGFVIIPHIVNDIGAFGSGFVVALTKTFGPMIGDVYREWFNTSPENYETPSTVKFVKLQFEMVEPKMFFLGNTQFVLAKTGTSPSMTPTIIVASMVGQHGVGYDSTGLPPVRYDAIAQSMSRVREYVKKLEYANRVDVGIHAPWFGTLRSGGEKGIIEALIQNIWIDRGLDVTMYDYLEDSTNQSTGESHEESKVDPFSLNYPEDRKRDPFSLNDD